MAEKHHVLGLLVVDGPASAEELDRWMHERIGLLGSTRRLVYRSLIALHADGLIRETGEVRGDPRIRAPHQIVYAATAKGVAEHKRWMREPLEPVKLADLSDYDWVPRILTGPQDAEAMIEEAQRRERQCLAVLGDEQPVTVDDLPPDPPWRDVIFALNRNLEIEKLKAEIETLRGLQGLARDHLAKMRETPDTD